MIKKIIRLIIVGIIVCLTVNTVFAADSYVITLSGLGETAYKDGKNTEAKFYFPYGIALDRDESIIVVDSYNNMIRRIKAGETTTIAGISAQKDEFGFPKGGFFDGDALKEARFNRPRSAVVDSKGNIFITDSGNNLIRKISDGKVTTFAGSLQAGYSDGTRAKVKFNTPSGIAIDKDDNLYIADSMNHVIRKISSKGEVTTYAGKNTADGGYKDGTSAEALFNEPSDIILDKDGIMYVTDSGNQVIRRIEGGKVSTFAGITGELKTGTTYMKGGFQNGFADKAKFNFPKGITVAEDGTIFVADTWNHRVRAIKTDGSVMTVAGTGEAGRKDNAVSEAMFNGPMDILYYKDRLYIADTWNSCIRTIDVKSGNLPQSVEISELISGIDFGTPTEDIQVWVDKSKVEFPDIKPYISNKKVYIPASFVLNKIGFKVKWFNKSNRMHVMKDKNYRIFSLVDNEVVLKDDRVMVETSYLAKKLGYTVRWLPDYRAVIIETKK